MRKIGKLFIQGLIALLPVLLTLYIIYWLATSAESLLGGLIQRVLPGSLYVPGMGVAAGFCLVLLVGVLLRVWVFNTMFAWGEHLLEKVPLVKSLYGSLRDLMGFFDASKQKEFNQVVMVRLHEDQLRMLGLVTREDFQHLSEGIGLGGTVAVYLPMSYQMGGFTVFVDKDLVNPVDMTVEEAMRFALTAAVSANTEPAAESQP